MVVPVALAVLAAVLSALAVAVMSRANPGVRLPYLGWPAVRPRLTTVSLAAAVACTALAYGGLSELLPAAVAGLLTFGPVLAAFLTGVAIHNARVPLR